MDVNKVCRICDKPSATRVNVFGTDADGKQILRLIRETLPIIVSNGRIVSLSTWKYSSVADIQKGSIIKTNLYRVFGNDPLYSQVPSKQHQYCW